MIKSAFKIGFVSLSAFFVLARLKINHGVRKEAAMITEPE